MVESQANAISAMGPRKDAIFDSKKVEDLVFGDSLGEGAFGNVKVGWLKGNPK